MKEYALTDRMSDMRAAYGETLVELGKMREDIFVLDADLACSTQTCMFGKEFEYEQRFFNCGVAEQNLMGTAAGLAAEGNVVFASTFAMFATGRAYEIIRNTISYSGLNVNIVATHGGVTVGEDGSSHQAIEDLALMRIIPNMSVFVPADMYEVRAVVRAVVEKDGPCYVRLSRPKFPTLFEEETAFDIGKPIVVRQGTDVTIFACGIMVSQALKAANMLEGWGIEAMVVNVSCIKPLDEDTICELASMTGAVITAEEHTVIGGLGSAVCESLSERNPMPVRRIGVRDIWGVSGKQLELLDYFNLSPKDIALAAVDLCCGELI